MDKERYKRAFAGVVPDPGFRERLARLEDSAERHKSEVRRSRQTSAIVAASIVLAVSLGLGSAQFWSNDRLDGSRATATPPVVGHSGEGVHIPKMKLPSGSSGAMMNMIGLIVYQGRIYTQSSTTISPEAAKSIRGEKLGQTKGNIDEWSKQADYAKEFASTTGISDVYAVKGYDSQFRIMTYMEMDGQVFVELFDCLNGLTVQSGADVFGKLKLAGQVKQAAYEPFDSWNNGLNQTKKLMLSEKSLGAFLDALLQAKPVAGEPLVSKGIFEGEEGEEGDQKFLLLQLADGSEVRLRLFENGYVLYGFASVFFQVERGAFDILWNNLN
ncbi:hypothetical protein [Paenibacillus koleovorans]|uniref:hypothetical protein n=1 Tax=Paenibacillus koleovorans TaxID=121608 RepID=UPI000FD6DCAE|nr:hypothetical protein [Paenibacillus koleovorans]